MREGYVFVPMTHAPYRRKYIVHYSNGYGKKKGVERVHLLQQTYADAQGEMPFEISPWSDNPAGRTIHSDACQGIFAGPLGREELAKIHRVLVNHPEYRKDLFEHHAFSDTTYNPGKQEHCVAEVTAMYEGLREAGLLQKVLDSEDAFRKSMRSGT